MKKGNLLIVDDEELIIKNLEYILKNTADKVFTALNGKCALKVFETEEVHCIICDINMPEMNGVELIKMIRENKNEVPFIFYTGHGSHDLMLEAIKYGAFDFLNKPHLDGIEETVSRGLMVGTGNKSTEDSAGDFMSEYQKLIASLDK